MTRTNRTYRLRRRPVGKVTEADLEFATETLPDLRDGQALVQTLVLSLDPTNRIWMSERRGYMPPVPLDDVMRGIGVGRVVESRREDLPVGAHVSGWTGWQDFVIADDAQLLSPFTALPDPLPAPASAFVGISGTPASPPGSAWRSSRPRRDRRSSSRAPPAPSGRWPSSSPRCAARASWASPAGRRSART